MKSHCARIAYEMGYRIKWNGVYSPSGKRLKLGTHGWYPYVNLKYKGKNITVRAHKLAAWQKFGELCWESEVVRHKDDNAKNFKLSNILLGTRLENYQDMHKLRRSK